MLVLNSFNSTWVRLILSSFFESEQTLVTFQFHLGTINLKDVFYIATLTQSFQFHLGTINFLHFVLLLCYSGLVSIPLGYD